MNSFNFKEIESRIAAIESRSAAEVIVVVQPQAGSYRDLQWLWAVTFALAFLVVAVHSPLYFEPDFLVVNAVFCGLAGYAAAARFAPMRRWVSTRARRQQQVQDFAAMAFTRLQVTHTRERSGLLLAVCEFEREAVLLPDLGLTARVSPGVFEAHRQRLLTANSPAAWREAVLETLTLLADELAAAWPGGGDSDIDELGNEVRSL